MQQFDPFVYFGAIDMPHLGQDLHPRVAEIFRKEEKKSDFDRMVRAME